MIGQSFGSYRAVRLVGRGGMGVVYAAEHPLLGSQAVVKQLRPELSAQRDVIERFFNEARAASRIVHPGIVRIFDFGYSDDGNAYFVMEFLEGESIGARLARTGRIPEAHAARLGRQIASALAAAHEAGIVHRDLKPDNVFLVPDEAVAGGERAKILDFGIAKLGGEAGEGVTVTRTGALLGSPLYMSPEQCRGTGEVDLRADIYALGCLLFAMTTGRPPFVGDGVGEIIGKHIYEQPPRPRELAPEISSGFEAVVMRALEKDPARRHPSMRALAAALGEPGGPEEAAASVAALASDDSASFAATADTILSTSPEAHRVTPRDGVTRSGGDRSGGEAAPTVPAVVAGSPTPTSSSTGGTGRHRTVAMWIAAALAAGMAGFFFLARVDEPGGGRGGEGPRLDTSAPATAPEEPNAGAGGGGAGGGALSADHGGTVSVPSQASTPTASSADAGVEIAQEVEIEIDAGPQKKKLSTRKLAKKKQTRPPIKIDENNPPIIQQQTRKNVAPEEIPQQEEAVEAE